MREAFFVYILLLVFNYGVGVASATVLLKSSSTSFPDLPAKFAFPLNSSGVCGGLQTADPLNGCSSLRNRFDPNDQTRLALIVRGECAFEDKIRNAQIAGFRAAIVYDDGRDGERNLLYMMMNPEGIKVHAVFVSKATGEILKVYAQKESYECCIYPAHTDRAWTVFAISFLSVIVILAFLSIAFITYRHWMLWRQTSYQPKSMDTRMVEALPQLTFSSGHLTHCHSRETCAICLEDYKDGEVLKVLPCQHEFHSSCVDSWLTKWGTFCPVCKLDMKNHFAHSKT